MVKFYVSRINAGKMKIEDVPNKWREAVEKELNKDNQKFKSQ